MLVVTYVDAKINGYGFLELDADSLKELRVSVGFRLAVMKVIKNLVHTVLLLKIWHENNNLT